MDDERAGGITLRVSEGNPEDAAMGTVRMDPLAFQSLDLVPGDVVQLAGRGATVARAIPMSPEYAGSDLVQADGVVRGNAGAGIDESVLVSRVAARPALSLVLSPVDTTRSFRRPEDLRLLHESLVGLAAVAGDVARAMPYGSRGQLFTVAGAAPPHAAVLVTRDTEIQILHRDANQDKAFHVTYEDVGGLHREIERIREMVELPLKRPDLFARLGVDAPKGVLIYGPPGCGKTLLARAVATETQAHFLHVNGPEIIHKYYGESEARLREIFDEASRHAPSIVFLDEIDAIAPRRSVVVGEVEKRVVAQLLALMDGLLSRGEVVVIGAANMPEMVDPALRRPGRFDLRLQFPLPDESSRLSILEVHTRGRPLAPEVDLMALARETEGLAGSHLEAICRRAASLAMAEFLELHGQAADHLYQQCAIGQRHFGQASAEVSRQ